MIEIPTPPKQTGDAQRDIRAITRYLRELTQAVRLNLQELEQQGGQDSGNES